MRVTIINNRWLQLEAVPPEINDLIDQHFSAKDPNAIYIDDSMNQSWDGVYHRYNARAQRLSRGYLQDLLAFCEQQNMPCEVVDHRPPSKYPMFTEDAVTQDILSGIKLEVHQVNGVKSCCSHEIGAYHHITGSGKTELMCAIVKLLQCPTIIIAEETIVVKQIRDRLKLRAVVDDVGMFFAGVSPSDQVVCVGSLQSIMGKPEKITSRSTESKKAAALTRLKNAKRYRELVSRCELLIIDECDKATNKLYRKLVMQYCNARYVYGFTGTLPDPEDEPVEWLNMRELVGNVISQVGRRYLERIGRIIPVKYITTVVGPVKKDDKAAFDIAVNRWIINNSNFHQMVCKTVAHFPNDSFLILLENIALGTTLEQLIPGSAFIHGKTSQCKRDKCIKDFENRKLRVLIGSKILRRGLDLKGGVDNVILCASSNKNSDLEQKVGRAVRINSRGWARVFDYLFVCNYYTYRHSRKRLRKMISLGYPTTVVANDKTFNGKDIIRPGFNLFRYL